MAWHTDEALYASASVGGHLFEQTIGNRQFYYRGLEVNFRFFGRFGNNETTAAPADPQIEIEIRALAHRVCGDRDQACELFGPRTLTPLSMLAAEA